MLHQPGMIYEVFGDIRNVVLLPTEMFGLKLGDKVTANGYQRAGVGMVTCFAMQPSRSKPFGDVWQIGVLWPNWTQIEFHVRGALNVVDPEPIIRIDRTTSPWWRNHFDVIPAPDTEGFPYDFIFVADVKPNPVPAWKRAKVGDHIRIREGALSYTGANLPLSAEVTDIYENNPVSRLGIVISGQYRDVKNADVIDILPPLRHGP